MTELGRFAIALTLSISAVAVFPQEPRAQPSLAEMQSAMLGDWVITFPNPDWKRGRLTITSVSQNSDGSFQIVGMYAYGDNPTVALKSGELTQSGSTSQLKLTTGRGSLFAAKSRGGGGFQGELTQLKGPPSTFRMEKAEDQSLPAVAPAQDSVNTLGMAEARQAIERSPVKRPYVEVGDCWSYRQTTNHKQDTLVNDYTLCVTYVDYGTNVILSTLSSGAKEQYQTFTAEWNIVTDRRTVRTSPTRFLKFPLHVGETYSFESSYRNSDSAEIERKSKWDMKVVGWEDVIVPAGKFRAVRIEGIGTNADGRPARQQTQETIWYVPEVNRKVKDIHVNSSGTSVQELTQYRLNR